MRPSYPIASNARSWNWSRVRRLRLIGNCRSWSRIRPRHQKCAGRSLSKRLRRSSHHLVRTDSDRTAAIPDTPGAAATCPRGRPKESPRRSATTRPLWPPPSRESWARRSTLESLQQPMFMRLLAKPNLPGSSGLPNEPGDRLDAVTASRLICERLVPSIEAATKKIS